MKIEEAEGFPLSGRGLEKYVLHDIDITTFTAITGVPGLCQKIEMAVLTNPEEVDWIDRYLPKQFELEDELRYLAGDRRAVHGRRARAEQELAALPPRPAWVLPGAAEVTARLHRLLSGKSGDYFRRILAARVVGDDLVVEFEPTGFIGSYLHRFPLSGKGERRAPMAVQRSSLAEIATINEEVLRLLRSSPGDLHRLHPRRFEELVAELVHRMGYEVRLTPYSKDEGVDIFALRREGLHPTLTVIDCKRYSPTDRIGPELVRLMSGLRQQHDANSAMLVTSSWFTAGARELQQREWPYEVALTDQAALVRWMHEFGWREAHSGLFLPPEPTSDGL